MSDNNFSLFPKEECFIEKDKDFIDQVAKFIHETTKTNLRWAECVATSMLSTVMGNRAIIDTKGRLQLNVWFLCIGPSGLAHKTIALKTYLIPILINTSKKLEDEYHLILPSKYSTEALIKFLTSHSHGIIIRDEFTGLLKESAGKEYLADSLEFLSEMYDGKVQMRTTITHGTQELQDVFVTFISATTPYLYKIMKPDFFAQGTGNRMNIELFNIEDTLDSPHDPRQFFSGYAIEEQRESFIGEVSDILAKIRNCHIKFMIPDVEAAKLWTEYEYQCRVLSKKHYKSNAYDLHYSYLARSGETALKLCALYAVSRRWSSVIADDAPVELLVLKEDMQRAIDKSKHHYQQFCNMLDAWRLRPEQANVRTYEEQSTFILDQITDKPSGISWTTLRSKVKWDSNTWKEVLKYLHQSERIFVIQGESSGGRKPILLIENNEQNLHIKGVRLDWRLIVDMLNL